MQSKSAFLHNGSYTGKHGSANKFFSHIVMVYGNGLGTQGKSFSQGSGWIRGNLTHSWNVDVANVSEWTISSFLGDKGKRVEIYLQTCNVY